MVGEKVTIKNETGLHLKPAAYFSRTAARYDSLITFTINNVTANAKSILSVLGACVKRDDEIEIVCEGPDEKEALEALIDAVNSGLGDSI